MSSARPNSPLLSQKLREYLSRRPEGASSEELARELFAAESVPGELAERIVRAAAEGDAAVALGRDGRWRFRGDRGRALRELSFLCLATRLSREGRSLRVGWKLVRGGRSLGGGEWTLGPSDLPSMPREVSESSAALALVFFRRRGPGVGWAKRALTRALGGVEGVWAVREVAAGLFPLRELRGPEEVAAALGLRWLSGDDPATEAAALAELWLALLDVAEEAGVTSEEKLHRLTAPQPLQFDRFAFGPDKIRSLPTSPGVYKMLDASGQVVYVGKARNLAARVPSYFRSPEVLSERDRRIVEAVHDFEVMPLGSELEALLTEHRLIRLYRPRLNQQIQVHHRPVRAGSRRDCVLVLPSVAPGCAEVFLLSRAGRLRQIRCHADSVDTSELRLGLTSLFFEAQEGEPEEEAEIAFRWLAEREPWELALFPERWSGLDEALRDVEAKVREVVAASVGATQGGPL